MRIGIKSRHISVKKMYDNNFLGKNNFIWFNGVVEDRQDTRNLADYECVVWVFIQITKMNCYFRFTVVATHSSYYFIWHIRFGSSPGFIVEGTWVFGYFRDGYAMQEANGNRNFAGKNVEIKNL